MLIRLATTTDIPAMMSLATHAATAAQWSREQYEQTFRQIQPRRIMLVLEEEAVLQGFLVALSAAGEWEIENIAVNGSARRRGLGSHLLGEFLAIIRVEGASVAFLEVRESNRAARALYEKWAFEESGRRPNYYASPSEDAVIYRLALS